MRDEWSASGTRKELLTGLAERGIGHEQPADMQKIVNAEKSGLFDVLSYVAYALPPLAQEQRAHQAQATRSRETDPVNIGNPEEFTILE